MQTERPETAEPATSVPSRPTDEAARSTAATTDASEDRIQIDTSADGVAFDRRLLGTNVPAWLSENLRDPAFLAATEESGASLVRMPGGSWSNSYDWLACELSDESGCFWTWAARPTDFVDYLQATGLPGVWTVSINQTAQQAAAVVAFFNGQIGDRTLIGVDRNGFDWETVDKWARLRATGGNPEPVPIELWEVGNEVYGGKPSRGGEECASFGWEDVWTCNGTDYVDGTADHDGYLAIRQAMLAVDSDISVGAVGVPDVDAWSNWGNEVIDAAGDQLDFYVVHRYGFDESPSPAETLTRPKELWPEMLRNLRDRLGDTPIAITEYNLVSVDRRDTEQSMTRAASALYIADTIGQFAEFGVSIANHWNLASGTADSGTNYGMVDIETGTRLPQFDALAMWSRAGATLVPTSVVDRALSVYPTRHADGRWSIIVVNILDRSTIRTFEMPGLDSGSTARLVSVAASDLTATAMEPTTETTLDAGGEIFELQLPAWSINVIEIDPATN